MTESKKWDIPPVIKIYEALGAIADNRVEEVEDEVRVYSSSRNKFYIVKCDLAKKELMTNDNGAFFVGYFGYPMIAHLMKIGELPFKKNYIDALKNIPWKDINVKNKDDYDKTKKEVDEIMREKGVDMNEFYNYLDEVTLIIENNEYRHLGEKIQPPKGY